jgi:hypothetical protein
MRKVRWIGLAVASLLQADAFCFGCSSSTSATPTQDAASDAITSAETGAVEDATSEAAVPCTPMGSVMVDQIDAATFGCYSAKCTSSLTACAANCDCNNTIWTAVMCTQSGTSAGSCFAPTIASSNPLVGPVVTCLGNNAECMMTDRGEAATTGPEEGDGGDGSTIVDVVGQ